jgi:membrane-bound serine protease (ClpP class)
VIPGFGVTGISGILLVFMALVLIMVNNHNFDFTFVPSDDLMKSLVSVLVGMIGAVVLIALTWNQMMGSNHVQRLVLTNTFQSSEGYHSANPATHLIGKTGIAHTRMTPSGRVLIDEVLYDAQARDGFIEKGEPVEVLDQSTFSLRVKKVGLD